jgi:hypothetical protein
MFKPYEARPVTRMAFEIASEVTKIGESTFECNTVVFKAYEEPKLGDFVVRLTEADTCSRAVLLERNIVPNA